MMSSTLQKIAIFNFMGPMVRLLIDALGLVLTWLFFAGAYMLIPNAKVKFVNAFVAGAMVGTTFHVIQWLFMTGQMYVTKYNAIYKLILVSPSGVDMASALVAHHTHRFAGVLRLSKHRPICFL